MCHGCESLKADDVRRILFPVYIPLLLSACVAPATSTLPPAALPTSTIALTTASFPAATQTPRSTPPPPSTFNPSPQKNTVINLEPPLPIAVLARDAIQPENAHMLSQVSELDNGRGQGIRFTQDGSRLLVLQDVLRVWEMSGQTVVTKLPIRTDMYSPFSVSPDGQIVVIGNYETRGDLQFWSLATKQMVREYKGGEQVRHLSFNARGSLIAVGRVDGSFNIFDMSSGEAVANQRGHASTCEGITFNPVTAQLAVNNDKSIDIWDQTLQHIQYRMSNPNGCEISQLEYSPNGDILAASMFWEKGVLLWENGNYLATLTHSNSETVWKVAWSPNGRLLAVVENTSPPQIVLWDVQNQTIARVLEGYGHELSFSPDGKYIVTQSEEGSLVLLGLSAVP